MDQPQQIAAKIVELILQAPDKTLTGVRLGAALQAYFPGFNPYTYRCRNLRQFVSKYVPTVVEKAQDGPNVFYTVRDQIPTFRETPAEAARLAATPDVGPLPTTPFIWKAFSNPAHPFVVVANRTTGTLQVLPQGSPISGPLALLPKPSPELHTEIARQFASTLGEPSKTNLEALLHDPKWYVRFSGVATKNGLGPQWSTFRRSKLIERFKSSLQELGVSPVPRHPTGPVKIPTDWLPPKEPTDAARAALGGDESIFRELICRVVSQLPLSELRSLKLPAGALFDALKR